MPKKKKKEKYMYLYILGFTRKIAYFFPVRLLFFSISVKYCAKKCLPLIAFFQVDDSGLLPDEPGVKDQGRKSPNGKKSPKRDEKDRKSPKLEHLKSEGKKSPKHEGRNSPMDAKYSKSEKTKKSGKEGRKSPKLEEKAAKDKLLCSVADSDSTNEDRKSPVITIKRSQIVENKTVKEVSKPSKESSTAENTKSVKNDAKQPKNESEPKETLKPVKSAPKPVEESPKLENGLAGLAPQPRVLLDKTIVKKATESKPKPEPLISQPKPEPPASKPEPEVKTPVPETKNPRVTEVKVQKLRRSSTHTIESKIWKDVPESKSNKSTVIVPESTITPTKPVTNTPKPATILKPVLTPKPSDRVAEVKAVDSLPSSPTTAELTDETAASPVVKRGRGRPPKGTPGTPKAVTPKAAAGTTPKVTPAAAKRAALVEAKPSLEAMKKLRKDDNESVDSPPTAENGGGRPKRTRKNVDKE